MVSNEFEDYRKSLVEEHKREVAIKKKHGLAALDERIFDLAVKMTEYLEKGGSEDDIAFQNYDRDMERLKYEKRRWKSGSSARLT